ncbi:MAG TPA: TrbC/VirB2 family protein [Luteibacter sp.]|uniref:TrbC/VirB2 family protein n=1 Tax=Luteibacter sp. TaxID=1886636 RepID=UPI002C092391|nr:TrbC/VirB2 family protein [Luteibacter sp.]HVI56687.1 TrbC/VirB2 family protein [Luteibacter sp.]
MNFVPRSAVSRKNSLPSLVVTALATLAILFPGLALAVDDVLPYQKGIDVFYASMTGPVPFIISLMGIVGCGAMLIFGGEISGFMRTMIFIVLVVSVIVQAKSVVSLLGLNWQPDSSRTAVLLPAIGQLS